jgi:hypothetical protein
MFYDSNDHYALALYANSKIVTIYRGKESYLLPAEIIGSSGL